MLYSSLKMEQKASKEHLQKHLKTLVGDRYPYSKSSRLNSIESYIESEFRTCGLDVSSHSFTFQDESFRNLIGTLQGQEDSLFIIAAHHDAVENSPGADDNASGVAAMLECARLLSQRKLRSTVQFISFNMEEFGMVGSSAYVQKLCKESRRVLGMLSLEMVGYCDPKPGSQKYPPFLGHLYPPSGDFIALVGNGKSKKILDSFTAEMRKSPGPKAEKLLVPFNGTLLPATRLSDHSPFWDAGYPALLVTDTSFFRNPHYHQPSDKMETLDLDFMTRVTDGIVSATQQFLR